MTSRTKTPRRIRKPGARCAVAPTRPSVAAWQATIRQADAKAATLLSVVGGMVTAVTDIAVTPQRHAALAVAVSLLTMLASAKAAWHLLAAIRPRLRCRPSGTDAVTSGRSRDSEARDLVETLQTIAVEKHDDVARSMPWLICAGATTGLVGALVIVGYL